jgi:hypothetical protein
VKPPGARATPPVIARKWHSASLCVGGVVFFPDPYYPVNALTGIAIGTGKSGHPPKTGLSGVGLGRGSSRVGGCARGCTRVRVNECNGDIPTVGNPVVLVRRRCFPKKGQEMTTHEERPYHSSSLVEEPNVVHGNRGE